MAVSKSVNKNFKPIREQGKLHYARPETESVKHRNVFSGYGASKSHGKINTAAY